MAPAYHIMCDVKDSVRGYKSDERDERVKRPSTSHNTTILYDRASDRACLMSRQLACVREKHKLHHITIYRRIDYNDDFTRECTP